MDSDRRLGWVALLFGLVAVIELLIRVEAESVTRVGRARQPGPLTIHIVGTAATVSAQGAVSLFALALLGTLPLGLLRPAAAGVAVTVANALSLGLFGVLTVAALAAQVLAGYRVGRLPGRRGGQMQMLAVALALPFVAMALAGSVGAEARVVVVLLASAGPAATVAGATRRREVLAAGAAEEVMADTLVEHMARGERARIARELHDVVAHHISMVSVQAETARLTTRGMPEEGARRLSEIGDTARAGLTEMRRLLGVLREDAASEAAPAPGRQPQPGLAQLCDLIDEARDASGTGIRLIISGPVAALDPGVELAVYRIVQEALTNSRRHAPGAAVDVELAFGQDTLRLRVRDNGPAAATTPGGLGLVGMRERAQAAGGSLRAGPAVAGGFLVEATLPAEVAA